MTTHFTNVVGNEIVVPLLENAVMTAANETFAIFKVPMAMTIRAIEMGLACPQRYTDTVGNIALAIRFGAQTVTGTAYTSITTYVLGTSNTTYISMSVASSGTCFTPATNNVGGYPPRPASTTTITNASMAKNDYIVVEVAATPINSGGINLNLICQVDDLPA